MKGKLICPSQSLFWKGGKSFKGGTFDKIPQLIFWVPHQGGAVHHPTSITTCPLDFSRGTPLVRALLPETVHILFGDQGFTTSFEVLVFIEPWCLIVYFEKSETEVVSRTLSL